MEAARYWTWEKNLMPMEMEKVPSSISSLALKMAAMMALLLATVRM